MSKSFDLPRREDKPSAYFKEFVLNAVLLDQKDPTVKFQFRDIRNFPKELFTATEAFFKLTGIRPNIMLASTAVYDQIDVQAWTEKENVYQYRQDQVSFFDDQEDESE
ncbi:MAG: hypothetical protein SVR04_12720, partial [Spirochaetota bacterium]|nr:hypothetical protein [Spirochaetota bacterium]